MYVFLNITSSILIKIALDSYGHYLDHYPYLLVQSVCHRIPDWIPGEDVGPSD